MGFTFPRGRFGGRASERAGERDIALDEADDLAQDLAQDVPGKRQEYTPTRKKANPENTEFTDRLIHKPLVPKYKSSGAPPPESQSARARQARPSPMAASPPPAPTSSAVVKYKPPTAASQPKPVFKPPAPKPASSPAMKASGRAVGEPADPGALFQMVNAARAYQGSNSGAGARQKRDSKGVILEGDKASYNGVVVRPNGTYSPKGTFGGSKGKPGHYFVVDEVKMLNDRAVAVGTLYYQDTYNLSTMLRKEHKIYFVTDLRPAVRVEHAGAGLF